MTPRHDLWHITSGRKNVTMGAEIMAEDKQNKKWSKLNILGWICATGIVLLVAAGLVVMHRLRNYPPKEAMLDIKAGLAARHAPKQLERFLEVRYGSMTNAANREKAFMDFFNVDHVKGLNFLVSHMPAERRAPNITAMAEWVANFRENMTPEERSYLSAQLNSPEGVAKVRQATSQYLQQDVRYRAANAMVISELLTTLTSLKETTN